MDIIVEKDDNKGGNGFNLAPEKRSKICQQIGKSIFLIEQSNFKVNDVLKTPVAIRSYREVNVFSAEITKGKEGIMGLMVNKEMFISGKNAKFVGDNNGGNENKENNNNGGNNNGGGNNDNYLIATDEKAARKYCIEHNIMQRENVRGMITQLQKLEGKIDQIIDADRDAHNTITA